MILKKLLKIIAGGILGVLMMACVCLAMVEPNLMAESRNFWVLAIELLLMKATALIGGVYCAHLLECLISGKSPALTFVYKH